MNTDLQPSLFVVMPAEKAERRKQQRQQISEAHTVNETLAQMQALREQLNKYLYNADNRPALNSPADAAALVTAQLEPLDHEELFVILLDRRNRVMQIIRLYVGSVNSSQVRIGELFKEAIRLNASAIIPAHNHPSGDPTPSPDDVAVTRAMVQAGKLLDIEVLDHLVIGCNKWISLKERGLGFS